jgi:major vault protein
LTKKRDAELAYQGEQNKLDISKADAMGSIETEKFKNMVSAIGAETIQAIATAGPEMQVYVRSFCYGR